MEHEEAAAQPEDVLSMGAAQVGGPVETNDKPEQPIDPDTGQPVD